MKHLKYDISSGVVVYLVALPLCLGIALASGAPLMSGIVSGIVGGVLVGLISGSNTSVSGPAAGLATIVLASITKLGGFELFSVALILAGVIQIVFGLLKGGVLANYIPSNVIKGLLAAIGVLLILKQIPRALGYDTDHEDMFAFVQANGENTFTHFVSGFTHFNLGSIIVAIVAMGLLIVWPKTSLSKLKVFPSSLIAVIVGIALSELFKFWPSLIIEQQHLVTIPNSGISSMFSFPVIGFSALLNYNVWLVAFTLAIVASLETLLNLEAVDNLDPHKRNSPPNRELIAQGVGNLLAGFIGGLPVTSVIVRSSVNIESGAKTKLSAIIHGSLLFISVLLIAPLINKIPLAVLASILIITGYKLARVSLFKEVYNKGWNQFIPFIATILGIIFTDLLIGVLFGLAVSVFYLLRSNFQNPFKVGKEIIYTHETIRIELPNQVSFLNKASIKETLWSIPENTKVVIDASNTSYIDNDVREILKDFQDVVAPEKQIKLNKIGLKREYQIEDHIQFINVLDKGLREKLTPENILQILRDGNQRFVNGKWSKKEYAHQVNATSSGQFPMVVILSCIDSRTSAEVLFDANLGDIISIRIAGNIVSEEVIGSIELAHREIGIKLIVVMGHSTCGAVSASIHNIGNGKISTITEKIRPVVERVIHSSAKDISPTQLLDTVCRMNTTNSVEGIVAGSDYIKEQIGESNVGIVSAYYDTVTGKVEFGSMASNWELEKFKM